MDNIKQSPYSSATKTNRCSKVQFSSPPEDSFFTVDTSCFLIESEVVRDNDERYVNEDAFALMNPAPVALFSEAMFATSSAKHLERLKYLHKVSLLHELSTSSAGTNGGLHAFVSSKRHHELLNVKEQKETFLNRIRLIVFLDMLVK